MAIAEKDDAGTDTRAVNNNGAVISDIFTRTNGMGVGKTTALANVDCPRSGHVAVRFDMTLFVDGGNITLRVESGGLELAKTIFVVGTTTTTPTLEFWTESGSDKFDLTIETSIAVAADRGLISTVIFGDG